ncbi:MAG: OFA family MFS transporter [Planctomycetaceae bacterium]
MPHARFELLDKRRTVAGPGFNRWLVPPAALCVHLCIGMAYGFSVFWIPLTKAVGITHSIDCPQSVGLLGKLTTTTCDWDKPLLGWRYTLFFVFLGSSAALFGTWLERAGPRKAAVVAACLWCGGLVISAGGVYWHQLWLMWLGSGVIGGIGLGLGYISPVSTLIKWFPDRRGMATGMAIMGFGGGAMVGSPLADRLIKFFAGPDTVGVWQSFLVLAAIYFVFMMIGAFAYRIPPEGWSPKVAANRAVAVGRRDAAAAASMTASQACRTRQFWLVWLVLCLNVSAGIGVIGMASPMLQEIFGGRLLGTDAPFEQLDDTELGRLAAMGAGFTGLLSLFNILGRFLWSSLSDLLGRKMTYSIFFLLGLGLYSAVPMIGRTGQIGLFCGVFCIILSMYGGGFAAIPAYLADLFGSGFVGAIHGRLLTAWSVAGILGPVLVNSMNEAQVRSGVSRAAAYDQTMLVLAGLLVAGFICNALVFPLARKASHEGPPTTDDHACPATPAITPETTTLTADIALAPQPASTSAGLIALSALWLLATIPIAWGLWATIQQSLGFLWSR